MRTPTLIIAILVSAVASTSCVVTYADFPKVDLQAQPHPHTTVPLYYDIEPSGKIPGDYEGWLPYLHPYFLPGLPTTSERTSLVTGVRESLAEHPLLSQAIATSSLPERGVHCRVLIDLQEPSKLVQGAHYTMASVAALSIVLAWGAPVIATPALVYSAGAVPYYTGEGGYVLRYILSVDQQEKQVYRYEIKKKGVGWLGLLPFAWVNFFTTDLKDAVQATTHQFVIEAERDGYLQQSGLS